MKREHVIVLFIALLGFLIRIYPHAFVIPYIGREEGGLIMNSQRIVDGDFRRLGDVPYGSLLGVAGLHILTRLSITTCAFIWNPIMGGLSIIVFYYILKNILGVRDPWVGTLLFASLDSHIYRTTLFGSSAEGTAILVLLLFVYTYFRINKPLSLILLFTMPWIHIIVFGVAVLWVVADQIFIEKENIGKKLILFAIIGGIALLSFLYVLPYQVVVTDIFVRFRVLSFDNLWGSIITRMLPILFKTLIGTGVFFGLLVYYAIKGRDIVSYMSRLVLSLLVVFTVLTSSHISPYRLLIYVGILGIMAFSIIEIRWKNLIAGGLMLIMLLQVTLCGWDINNCIYDGVTMEEVEMVDWLKEYDPGCVHYNVLWDDSGKQLLLYKMPIDYYNPPVESEKRKDAWISLMIFKDMMINGTLPADLVDSGLGKISGYTSIEYVIYSNRFATQAHIMSRQDYGELEYSRYEIKDIWANATNWKAIYDGEGGKIYESQ